MEKELIVLKFGSSCLVDNEGLDHAKIDSYAAQIASLSDYGVIVVSSGAVAAGKRIVEQELSGAHELPSQAYAMLGSAAVSEAWRSGFAKQNRLSGQLLVTHREIDDKTEGQSLERALKLNASHNIISVINENDALSEEELKKLSYGGDNDGLAAHVAARVGAKQLLLLTGVDGFLRKGVVVAELTLEDMTQAYQDCYTSDNEGTGSMYSKLDAAEFAAKQGILVTIANAASDYKDALSGIIGTRIEC